MKIIHTKQTTEELDSLMRVDPQNKETVIRELHHIAIYAHMNHLKAERNNAIHPR